jgi:hypothetical protein
MEMKNLNTYYVSGQFAHIRDLGRCLATSLYDLLDSEGISYYDYETDDLEILNQDLENGHTIWLGDYIITKVEDEEE